MDSQIKYKILEKKDKLKLLLLIISLTGIGLRLFHYFYNRSLWMDEVYLSSSFLHFNYAELATRALDHDQKAPIGFLWLVKLTVDLFGKTEMALRVVPLIAGIISIFLFSKVCRYFLKPAGQIMALSIFVFAPAIIYHSVEIKQYSTECLATILALYLFIRFKDRRDWQGKLLWGVLGAIVIWFSYSVIFVFAGIAAAFSLQDLVKKNWKPFFSNMLPFLLWMLSFGINYLLFTHRQAESGWVVYFFKTYNNFMPFPPHSIDQLKWFPRNFQLMMDYPLGLVWDLQGFNRNIIFKLLSIPLIPIILMVTGLYALFINHRRNFFTLLFPVLLMLLASGLYLYPLLERFWIFIAPVFILFIALGFEYYQDKIKSTYVVLALFLVVIIGPVAQSGYYLIHPEQFYKHKKSYERESLVYINDNFKNGDAVYNYWNNHPGFDVYQVMHQFKFKAVEGGDFRKISKSLEDYNHYLANDFKQFEGKERVWVIYNNQFLTDIGDLVDEPKWYYKNTFTPTENLIRELNKIGKPVKKIVNKDVTVYLFDLQQMAK